MIGPFQLARLHLLACLVTGASFAAVDATQLVASARAQVGVTTGYDPAYRTIRFPNGDVPLETGVCADVIVRAFRGQRMDLQQLVNQDMAEHFAAYPANWGLKKPDRNIDHRRVPNLERYFERKGWALDPKQDATAFRAGDIVSWRLPGNLPHIGIVSDRRTADGRPLVFHNVGRGAREEDVLFRYTLHRHFRPAADAR